MFSAAVMSSPQSTRAASKMWREGGVYILAMLCMALLLIGNARAADFLEPEQAFKLKGELRDAQTVVLTWTIAPGYKLYREPLRFEAEGQGTTLGKPTIPDGAKSFDTLLNKPVETYHDSLVVTLPVQESKGPFVLTVGYQGCAEAGLCYPPAEQRLQVNPTQAGALKLADAAPLVAAAPAAPATTAPAASAEDEGSFAQRTLNSGSYARIGLAFLVFGLLLSFTPCVLPMVPILSSIIVGEGSVTRRRGFLLAVAYCLGMALVYTSLGVAAGLAGEGLAGALQKPWVLATFALLLLGLSLSMFDVYQLQLPSALQSRLSEQSGRLKGGRFIGVFVMGALSALIVGPCVAAPLAGALLYISQTRDVLIGAWALFAMAMGMSVPLLLTGLSAGSLLPRAGGWMNEVKHVFGLMLIAVAIWMVNPILPVVVMMALWGSFALLCAAFLPVFSALPNHAGVGLRAARALGWVFLVVGLAELVGAASGGREVLQPLAHLRGNTVAASTATGAAGAAESGVTFQRIRTSAELAEKLKTANKPVILDFYADWCVSCKEMENLTFSDAKVAALMHQAVLLQVDVTANTTDDRALMKQFNLFGPPGMIFFDKTGQEIPNSRVIGYMGAADFTQHLQRHFGGK